jgi:hypothetical protein
MVQQAIAEVRRLKTDLMKATESDVRHSRNHGGEADFFFRLPWREAVG